jgi:threonine synthase
MTGGTGMNTKVATKAFVNEDTAAEVSLLLRYYPVLRELYPEIQVSKANIVTSSISEGARLFFLAEYGGVEIWVCDESSLMATGSYKDLDACLITAIARHTGLTSVVLSSGGNLGYAMARYAGRAGLRVYLFHPKSTLYKLDAANFDSDSVKVIVVDRPEPEVKALARNFAEAYQITHGPNLQWRYAASAVRAMHIAEQLDQNQMQVDWLAQTICAGFGPVGIYNCWDRISRSGRSVASDLPRFLGVQQAANAPIVRAWQAGEREITKVYTDDGSIRNYIEPGLYNTNPSANYPNLIGIIHQFGGHLLTVDAGEYHEHEDRVVSWFRNEGLEFTRIPETGDILERAGILTGVGIVKAIDRGAIKVGSRVLYLLTGGFRKVPSFRRFEPSFEVPATESIAAWVGYLGALLGL